MEEEVIVMDDEILWEDVMFDWFPNLDPDSPEDQEEIGETLMGMGED